MQTLIIFSSLLSVSFCGIVTYKDVEKEEYNTPPPPPKPYAFGYAAGRFPGHIDRTHSEVSDGSGVVQGSYSYVDPRQQIRTVEYTADQNGFHPVLNNNAKPLPDDTPVVAAAKQRHLAQYTRIANARLAATPEVVLVPVDTKAVQYAKDKHLSLYQKIAEEHARIAAERKELQLAEEANNNPNSLEEHY